MRKFYNFIFIFILITHHSELKAQEVIVEATQLYEERIESSRTATVIHLDNDQQLKSQTVAEILNKIPGVEVIRQGGIGQTTSAFIRGARSEDTLVLIDGTEANDAMSPAFGYDFSTMSSENIERIEVYRGPQSVRFGAGALGGVINIVTRTGKGKIESAYLGEFGSFTTSRQSITNSGAVENFNYSIAGSTLSTNGFSAASEKSANTEADGARVCSGSIKIDWAPTQSARLETTLRYTIADLEIDSHGGLNGDDPNNKTISQQLITGVTGTERFFADQLKVSLGAYFSDVNRKGRNEPDTNNATDSAEKFLSENRKIQTEVEWLLGEVHTLRFGLNYRDESGTSESVFNGVSAFIPRKKQTVMGESITYLFESETWFFDLGTRLDQSSKVSSVPSYRASLGRILANTKVFVSYGTGYKLPSLYQLYSTYGDENLQRENSTTLEATLERKLSEKSNLMLSVFENKFREMIDFNMTTNRYFNLSKSSSHGFEVQSSIEMTPSLQLSGSYTYLESKDESTNLKLLRRPQNVVALSAELRKDNYQFFTEYRYRGEREDADPGAFNRITMKSYSLISLGGYYNFKEWFKLHARIENLFDESYEEVAGYGSMRRSFFVGLSGNF